MGMRNHEKSVHCIQVARLSALFSCAWNLPFQMQSIPNSVNVLDCEMKTNSIQ